MVKWHQTLKSKVEEGKTADLVGIGLSKENVKRLRAGEPILFDLGHELLNLPAEQLFCKIVYGENEDAISASLEAEQKNQTP